jgi:putative ABC transport system permease protein
VVGAALMLSTFWKLISLDAGFEREHVLLVNVDRRTGNYPKERWSAVYQEMLEQLRTIPGVRSASVSAITPVCHCRWAGEVVVEGYSPKSRDDAMASFNNVSDGYFETVGTPIVAGRDFNSHDTINSQKVAIISESMVRKYFGTRLETTNPLGQHFRTRDGDVLSGPIEIVGIAKDAKYGSLRDEPTPFVFIPWSQGGAPGPLAGFELRAAGGAPTALISGVRSASKSTGTCRSSSRRWR